MAANRRFEVRVGYSLARETLEELAAVGEELLRVVRECPGDPQLLAQLANMLEALARVEGGSEREVVDAFYQRVARLLAVLRMVCSTCESPACDSARRMLRGLRPRVALQVTGNVDEFAFAAASILKRYCDELRCCHADLDVWPGEPPAFYFKNNCGDPELDRLADAIASILKRENMAKSVETIRTALQRLAERPETHTIPAVDWLSFKLADPDPDAAAVAYTAAVILLELEAGGDEAAIHVAGKTIHTPAGTATIEDGKITFNIEDEAAKNMIQQVAQLHRASPNTIHLETLDDYTLASIYTAIMATPLIEKLDYDDIALMRSVAERELTRCAAVCT